MYRPPENCNRVKLIKSKFENGVNGDISLRKYGIRENTNIDRCDSAKRTIKRTPAFRIDVNCEKNVFQRNTFHNRSFYLEKVQQFNNVLKDNCDKNEVPVIEKSKSAHDFQLIRSKFNGDLGNCQKSNRDFVSVVQSSALYAEPIPKALRNVNLNKKKSETNASKRDLNENGEESVNGENNIKAEEDAASNHSCLTNTLKAALNRPLPKGPAPQKPPRTFEHNPVKKGTHCVKNSSFLHNGCRRNSKHLRDVTVNNRSKHDARYMLSKLENALRNNKIQTKRLPKVGSLTASSRDGDGTALFNIKAAKQLPPILNLSHPQSLNFNCLHGLTSCRSTYEEIKEPNASFFVNFPTTEPIYDEPFHVPEFQIASKNKGDQRQEKDLHYLSTPLLSDEKYIWCSSVSENLQTQVSEESSSQSSFMSDWDSVASTPVDEHESLDASSKIKDLISAFEAKLPPTNSFNNNTRTASDKTSSAQNDNDEQINMKSRKLSCNAMVDKFQTYVKTMPKYEKPSLSVVIPDNLADLCFPEAASGPLDISNNAQCYSLVITNDQGERTFGYCRRVIPEGSNRCIPLTYCILSKHRAPRFYKKILTELESCHGIPSKLRDELINCFYYNKFPQPGQSIKVDLPRSISDFKNEVDSQTGNANLKENAAKPDHAALISSCNIPIRNSDNEEHDLNGCSKTELTLTLHHDSRYEEADLNPLHKLPAHILLKIFASLLLERKVILISCVISNLSCCVDALQSILYPFSWPHTFIPILPECLWLVVESPTPVICGVLSVSVVNKYKIEDGIVVDLDEGSILSEEGDEDSILSNSMKKEWYQGMALARANAGNYVRSVYLSDAYLKVFIVSLKHYKNHISGGTFDKESFIKHAKTKGVRRFLKWFTETAMFVSFIETVMNNPNCYALFDQRIEMYGSNASNLILTKLLEWKK